MVLNILISWLVWSLKTGNIRGGFLPVTIYIIFEDWLLLKMSLLSIKDEYKNGLTIWKCRHYEDHVRLATCIAAPTNLIIHSSV